MTVSITPPFKLSLIIELSLNILQLEIIPFLSCKSLGREKIPSKDLKIPSQGPAPSLHLFVKFQEYVEDSFVSFLVSRLL